MSREALLKLLRSEEVIEMKLVSGGDCVIWRYEEVKNLGLSGISGVVSWPYHFEMASDGPVLWRIGKPMPKP